MPLALVNSDNAEDTNQQALDAAMAILLRAGHPYEVFLEHERFMFDDPTVAKVLGSPNEKRAQVWADAEEKALSELPFVNDDTYLIWQGDN